MNMIVNTITKVDVLDEAKKVSESWCDSLYSLLDACHRVHVVLDTYKNEHEEISRFLDGLASGGILTENERKQQTLSPKLSKLRCIGENAPYRLSISESSPLPPDYTTLYQICVLKNGYEKKGHKNSEERVRNLVEKAPCLTL